MTRLRPFNCFFFATLLAAVSGTALANPVEKIHPDLRKRLAQGERVPVVIVLAQQPQAEIMQRLEGDSWLETSLAESDYRRLASLPFTPDELLAASRSRIDELTVNTRRTAARQIEAAVGPIQQAVSTRLTNLGATSIRRFRTINMLSAEIPPASLASLENDPDIAEVFEVGYAYANLAQSTVTLGAPAYWNRGFTGAGQSVVVLDSGIRTNHAAFSGRLTSRAFLDAGQRSPCFDDRADSVEDLHGHGSHVSGIVASQGTPEFSTQLGVARGLGTLYSFKVAFLAKTIAGTCNGGASVNYVDAWDAIDWAVLNTPARIFNFSFGNPANSDDSPSSRIFDFLTDVYGITVVVAAGNDGPAVGTVSSPANAYNVISVGNVDDRRTPNRTDDNIHPSSSRGPTVDGRFKPDVSAPGAGILSADAKSNSFISATGTSMAAPHVAGAVALIRQSGVTNPLAIKALLINTTDQSGWNPEWGFGSVNLSNTLARANYAAGEIAPGGVIYYRGSAAANLKATLVWNRHVTINGSSLNSIFTDLNLFLFGRPTNTLISTAAAFNQNVEQVSGRVAGDAVIKIKANPGVSLSNEAYAIALSESGFVPATGPAVSLACVGPASVATGASFSVECTATNRGELEAFGAAVEATLPAGVTGGRNQSFGNIPGNGRISRSFTFTAANTGTHRIAFALTGSSFGEPYSASGSVSVTGTGASANVLRLSVASLNFRFRLGSAAPAAQNVNITTGSPVAFTVVVPSEDRWLSATPASGTSPATLRISVNATGLAPGAYTSLISVRAPGASNSPQNLPVTLQVEGVANIRVANRLITRAIPQGEACAQPEEVTKFSANDPRAYVWFLINDAKAGDRATVTWHQPDGSVFQTGSWGAVASDGIWCFSASMDIAGRPPASIEGKWTVKINWNGVELFTLDFTLENIVDLVDVRMAKSVDGCTVSDAVDAFQTFDPEAFFFFRVRNAKKDDVPRNEWISPDGVIIQSGAWTPVASDGAWCFRSRLPIENNRAASRPGTWTVKVYWNNTQIITQTFRIVPPVVVEQRVTSSSMPEERLCSAPPDVTVFSPGDTRALLWFSVRDVKAGETPVAEWYAPGGELYSTTKWEPITWSGNGCLWTWITIAGQPPAEKFGQWNVKLLWNDRHVFTSPFSIAPVRIERRLFTKTTPPAACAVPPASQSFLTTDARIYIWYLVLDAKEGDVAKVEWYDPSGRQYTTSTWLPLARNGNFCFNGSIAIAGAAAAQRTGTWTVTVSWNGAPLYGDSFTLDKPPDAAGATIPVDVTMNSQARPD